MNSFTLQELYQKLYENVSPHGWWPAVSDWEIIWGAVLIQNTNWQNVDLALASLKEGTGLNPKSIRKLPSTELEQLIRSAGFYTRKAQTIMNLANYFDQYDDDLEAVRLIPRAILRKELLELIGVGQETADTIMLYAIQKSGFIVDKYSRRLFQELGVTLPKKYDDAQLRIEKSLPELTLRGWQNFHAMIVLFNQQYKLPRDFDQSFLSGVKLSLNLEVGKF